MFALPETKVIHYQEKDTRSESIISSVIVRTYVHGRKGPGPSSLVFHVFQDGCSLYIEHFLEFMSINPQFKSITSRKRSRIKR